MSSSPQKFYLDQESFGEQEIKTEEKFSQDIINIRELFRLLSYNDKALVKRLIREENIF